MVIAKDDSIVLANHFQEIIEIELFGLQVTIIHNDVFCVA
jgi:hypothetical protein